MGCPFLEIFGAATADSSKLEDVGVIVRVLLVVGVTVSCSSPPLTLVGVAVCVPWE